MDHHLSLALELTPYGAGRLNIGASHVGVLPLPRHIVTRQLELGPSADLFWATFRRMPTADAEG